MQLCIEKYTIDIYTKSVSQFYYCKTYVLYFVLSKIYTHIRKVLTLLFFHKTAFWGSNSMCIWLGTSHLNTSSFWVKAHVLNSPHRLLKHSLRAPPKFHIYYNLHRYQPEYYKCKLSKGVAKFAAELVPIVPNI